jgi:hypothetical protein
MDAEYLELESDPDDTTTLPEPPGSAPSTARLIGKFFPPSPSRAKSGARCPMDRSDHQGGLWTQRGPRYCDGSPCPASCRSARDVPAQRFCGSPAMGTKDPNQSYH